MKKIFLISFVFILISCGKEEYNSEYYQEKEIQKNCREPENPYSEGGHYAGYNWAMGNGGNCNGNSNSFNEGCEEYYLQQRDYEECKK